jgi:S-adenosylmethionine:tRNA ribosyltransferase-isomerase
MRPARTYPRRRDDVRLLVIDPAAATFRAARTLDLPALLAPGDLLVVNDAATLPGSLRGRDQAGRELEARLLSAQSGGRFAAVLFGAGDWRARTEDRPPPAALAVGARLAFGALAAEVVAVSPLSPRLVGLRFDAEGAALWRGLYREGRPVQYSYLAHELPLWAVQTVYAARPWAFEMPSAGRPLSWEILLALRERGVRWAPLTHAAGLSATGDPALDAALPLAERFEIPAETAAAVNDTRARGGRVVAVGTTVVRALEGAAVHTGAVRAGPGETDLRITPSFRLRVTSGILSGAHGAGESHAALLAAFTGPPLLAAAIEHAERQGFVTHELGDAMLVLDGSIGLLSAAWRSRGVAADGPDGGMAERP